MTVDRIVKIQFANSEPLVFPTDMLVVKTDRDEIGREVILSVESRHLLGIIQVQHITQIDVYTDDMGQVNAKKMHYRGSGMFKYTAHVFISPKSHNEGIVYTLPEDNVIRNV